MNATSALLMANHRITELQGNAEQARLAAEIRHVGRTARPARSSAAASWFGHLAGGLSRGSLRA